MKQVKESVLIHEIVNKDIEKTAKNVKSSEEAVEAVNEMEEIIKSDKCNVLWLAYQQDQIFGISKSTIVFEISVVKLINKYPIMKSYSLFIHFLKNIFKIILKNCHENDSIFK